MVTTRLRVSMADAEATLPLHTMHHEQSGL
jgi:hypothetical protein